MKAGRRRSGQLVHRRGPGIVSREVRIVIRPGQRSAAAAPVFQKDSPADCGLLRCRRVSEFPAHRCEQHPMSQSNPFASFPDDRNPYAAPQTPFGDERAGGAGAEAIRQQYLSHEASIQSIGLLYLLGSIFGTLVGVAMLVMAANAQNAGLGRGPAEILIAVVILGLGIVQGFVGVGLRRLQRWTRIPVGILSGIGLIGIPILTLINGYILYLIFSAKGSMVFSEPYQQIIRQTPHIRYKTSIIVWIFLFLLLGLITLGVVVALVG